MYHVLWKILFVCCVVRVIECGVKIEITRVKEPPKPVSIAQNGEIDQTTPDEEKPTEITTILTTTPIETTTTSTLTATTVKSVIDSSIQRLTNSTLSSSSNISEVTTISPLNVTEPIKPAQANTSTINSIFVNNLTLSYAKDLNPYLSEFTRRQMRRKLIPQDYYCPCDLKVKRDKFRTKKKHFFRVGTIFRVWAFAPEKKKEIFPIFVRNAEIRDILSS